MAIKRKNNIKQGSDLINLCYRKIIPTAKMYGNGKLLSQNRRGGTRIQDRHSAAEATLFDVLMKRLKFREKEEGEESLDTELSEVTLVSSEELC